MAEYTGYMEKEYDVECDGQIMKLKPLKVWMLAPKAEEA